MKTYTAKVEVTLTRLRADSESHATDHAYEIVDEALTDALKAHLFDTTTDPRDWGFVVHTTSVQATP